MPDSNELDVDRYLSRIGLDRAPDVSIAGLSQLQRAHLTTVPFENVDVYDQIPVRTDLEHSVDKVVNRHRGGWCFELNGAFSALLTELGFDVVLLGAAVLLSGPNAVIDHLTLEVRLDNKSFLVDVGFGDSFATPLDLALSGPQDGYVAAFEFIDSSQGMTLTRHDNESFPVPQYRFKRNVRALSDFDEASTRLQADTTLDWRNKPFASRLLADKPERITLLRDRLKHTTPTVETEEMVAPHAWDEVLRTRFDVVRGQ